MIRIVAKDWRAQHEGLKQAVRESRKWRYELMERLRVFEESRGYLELGYANILDYAERELELKRGDVYEMLRLARKAGKIPALREAIKQRDLDWSKASRIGQVVTPETASAWVEIAKSHTCREVERLVAAAEKGQLPEEVRLDAPRRMRLGFTVPSEVKGLFHELVRTLCRQLGRHVSDDEAFELLLKQAAAGEKALGAEPTRAERPTFAGVIHQCPDCRRAQVETRGGLEPMDKASAERHLREAKLLDLDEGTKARSSRFSKKTRTKILAREGNRCAVPDCCHRAFVEAHHKEERSFGGDGSEENGIPLCATHHKLEQCGRLRIFENTYGGRVFVLRSSDGSTARAKIVDVDSPVGFAATARAMRAKGAVTDSRGSSPVEVAASQ